MNEVDPIQRILEQAIAHHRAGRLAEAEQIYRGVLAHNPDHPGALGLLGTIAHQTGNLRAAEELLLRSVQLAPQSAGMLNNLGLVRIAMGKLDDAQSSFEQALKIDPAHAPARNNLGDVLCRLGLIERAIACYHRVLQLTPDDPDALTNLGDLLLGRGQHDQAVAMHRRAIELAPSHAAAHNNLGKALADVDTAAAAQAFSHAIRLQPNHPLALTNLGLLRVRQGYPAQAVSLHEQAIGLAPRYAAAHVNLGIALLAAGRVSDAILALRRGLEIDPSNMDGHDNVLWGLLFEPTTEPSVVYAEYRKWATRFADPLTPVSAPVHRSREISRPLRIGYVSGDFRDHAVAHFIEPVLAAHGRSCVEVFCYANVQKPDHITRRLATFPHHWIDIAGRSDDAVVEQIRKDEIDILVDLSGHSAHHRLRVFARRPAPVQVTWLGYPNTSGMSQIDCWITDGHCDPLGQSEYFASERLVRLPQTFTCYRAPDESPPVNALPALSSGRIVFGSFNMVSKMNEQVVALWAQVLMAVAGSRLLMVTPMVRDTDVHSMLIERFARHGIGRDRMDIRPAQGA